MKAKPEFPETLTEAVKYFADMDTSIKFMAAIRWPDGKVSCPKCNSSNAHYMDHATVEVPGLQVSVLGQGRHGVHREPYWSGQVAPCILDAGQRQEWYQFLRDCQSVGCDAENCLVHVAPAPALATEQVH